MDWPESELHHLGVWVQLNYFVEADDILKEKPDAVIVATGGTHSIAFKCQVVQEYLAGETLRGLARRHDLSRTLIRVWTPPVEGKKSLRHDSCGKFEGHDLRGIWK